MRSAKVALAVAFLLLSAASVVADRAPVVERVALRTYDNQRILAEYHPPRRGPAPMAIVLCDATDVLSDGAALMELLREARVAALLVDLRNYNAAEQVSEADAAPADDLRYERLYDIVRAAYDWMAQREDDVDRARFVIAGAGVAANAALQYAIEDRSVDAIVCFSPHLAVSDMDGKAALRSLGKRSVLLIGGAEEQDDLDLMARSAADDATGVVLASDAVAGDGLRLVADDGVRRAITRGVRPLTRERPTKRVYASLRSSAGVYHTADAEWVKIIRPSNLRVFSSAAEAEQRGLRASRTKGPRQRGGRE